ncbi:MAG: CpsD/CapB family tyrosine-protein kinase [Clostridiales bacterium]|nr:CpsD/CapB family tyrosine-protein kinase [Clostridiales bacterium]
MPSINENSESIFSESFRSIKASIKYSSADKNKNVILITSANAGEGKSTISSNLARVFAEDKKVLLIDCDLRKPTIHKKFQLPVTKGLTDFLVCEVDFNNAIKKYSDNLHIIVAGTKTINPAKLIDSENMDSLIKLAREKYDYVILDTSPLGVFADSQILINKVDGVVVVAEYEKTQKDKLKNCKEIIEKYDGKIIGAILNNVRVSKESYYGYY